MPPKVVSQVSSSYEHDLVIAPGANGLFFYHIGRSVLYYMPEHELSSHEVVPSSRDIKLRIPAVAR